MAKRSAHEALGTTGKALLAAICDRPEDDDQRRVFADWLEENDQVERAEAIRLEIRRRALGDLEPEAWVIDTRLERISERYRETWEGELPQLEGVTWIHHGGLAGGVRIHSPQLWREHEDAIVAAAPVTSLRTFVVTLQEGDPIPDCPGTLAQCRHLQRIRMLDLNGMTSPETFGIDQLARSHNLAGVRELRLRESAHEDLMLEHLARCPAWPSLEELDLEHGMFRPPGLRVFARSPLLSSLQALSLARCGIGDAGLRELIRSPHIAGLRRLRLSDNGLTSRVMKALVEYPWEHLERLDLADNALTGAGVRHLAGSPRLATLRALDLAANHEIRDDGAVALAESPNLGALCDLDLGWLNLRCRGLAVLAGASWLPRIRRLRWCGFRTGRAGLEILSAAPLRALRALDLCYSDLDADTLRGLLAASWLPGLTHLYLNNNALGEQGADLLVEAAGLDGLVELNLRQCAIPDAAGDRLRGRFGDRVVLKWPGD
jgi:uncharacterized protein (TIGR02996 family)